ncbi:formate dehydrogenase accessory sulfurtransferase FdhD [Paracoccus chinensis]
MPWRWSGSGWVQAEAPAAPEEAAVAIVIDGTSQAVLMATPHDLADLALGFALTEGLIASPADVTDREIAQVRPPAQLPGVPAYEARLWLRPGLASGLAERRRSMVGPVGCGLCGVDSIAAALPQVVRVAEGARLSPQDVGRAMKALSEGQRRWRETPAIHAAGFWSPAQAVVREDVGRHNALDKLAGALANQATDARAGAIVMSSRLSVDLVQKTARIGASVLIGASTPTRLAIAWAEAAGITLIGRARGETFDLYTHPQRIEG